MEIKQLPALRVLLLFIVSYLLLNCFSLGITISLVFVFFTFVYLKFRELKNSILFIILVLICCAKIHYKPVAFLPPKCYKIEHIVKANKEKVVFIAKGKKKVLFTLKIRGNDFFSYYTNDVVEYRGGLKPLTAPKSLDGFVYADYLSKKGIDSIAYPKVFPKVIYRDSTSVNFFASNLKESIISYLISFSKITDSTKGFTIALLTGDKSFLDKKGYELFRESGVVHVLAISGLHVGILYITLYFLFSKLLRLNNRIVFYLIALLLIGYAFVTGLSPSVIRAVIMFTLIQFGKSYQKSANTLNIIFASAFLMLFYEPDLILDVGFQLSYSAVIGIVLIMQYSGLDNLVKNKYLSFLWNVLLVNFAAFLFTSPVIAFHFGIINFTSIWASILVVPIITIGMCLGILLLILSFYPFFAEKIYLIIDYLFLGLNLLLNFIVENLHSPVRFFMDYIGVIIFFSICISLITRKLGWMVFTALFCGIILCFPKSQKVQFLKLNSQIQVKSNHQIFCIQKGDSLFLNDLKIHFKDNSFIELNTIDGIKTIDFNVNNYQSLILEF